MAEESEEHSSVFMRTLYHAQHYVILALKKRYSNILDWFLYQIKRNTNCNIKFHF